VGIVKYGLVVDLAYSAGSVGVWSDVADDSKYYSRLEVAGNFKLEALP